MRKYKYHYDYLFVRDGQVIPLTKEHYDFIDMCEREDFHSYEMAFNFGVQYDGVLLMIDKKSRQIVVE